MYGIKKKMIAIAATTVVGLGGAAGTAQASTAVTNPFDPPSYAMASGWNNVKACDGQVDGNRVRAWYSTVNGDYPSPDWAPSAGCTGWHTPSGGNPINWIRVCTENEGCSDWVANNGTT